MNPNWKMSKCGQSQKQPTNLANVSEVKNDSSTQTLKMPYFILFENNRHIQYG